METAGGQEVELRGGGGVGKRRMETAGRQEDGVSALGAIP